MNDYIDKYHYDKIEKFNNYEPLLIHGLPGCGKTIIAEELLKDTVLLRIDTSLIRKHKNMKEYIINIVNKKNINIMLNQEIKRGLLIDDIHIFHKYDKLSFKSIINFIKEKKYYKSKIICTCQDSFLKNKDLNIFTIKLNIKYTYSLYYKYCEIIIKEKEVELSYERKNYLIRKSNYNFHKLISELNIIKKSEILFIENKDIYDEIEITTHNLLNNEYTLTRLYELCCSDDIVINLNLLENMMNYIHKSNYLEIYLRIYDISVSMDIIDTFLKKNYT